MHGLLSCSFHRSPRQFSVQLQSLHATAPALLGMVSHYILRRLRLGKLRAPSRGAQISHIPQRTSGYLGSPASICGSAWSFQPTELDLKTPEKTNAFPGQTREGVTAPFGGHGQASPRKGHLVTSVQDSTRRKRNRDAFSASMIQPHHTSRFLQCNRLLHPLPVVRQIFETLSPWS